MKSLLNGMRVLAIAIGLSGCLLAQESIMVMEAYSGKVLIASNSTEKRPIGSLTKIATASIAVDWATASNKELSKTMMTVPQVASMVGGANPLNLQPGDRISLRDAIAAAMLASDNIAAMTIADHVGRELASARGKGSDPLVEFVGEMNRLAQFLGMNRTRFANPHGLERPGTKAYSTAADVARMSVYAMRRSAITFLVRQKSVQIQVNSKPFTVRNTNELVGESGIFGLKTGTTAGAGACVVEVSEKDPLVRKKPDGTKGVTPRRLVVVVLNQPDRFNRARTLIHSGWGIYDAWLESGAPVKDREREIISLPNAS